MSEPEVLIVGGGIAGLCCANHLHNAGVSNTVLEAADDVGGRARTFEYEGYQLDRGFQVLLTEYPEAKQVLDYEKLRLGRFEPGAMVRFDGAFHRFVDPWRRPRHTFATAFTKVATFGDKLRVAKLRRDVRGTSLEELNSRPEEPTISRLRKMGFSGRIIDRFFKPFLGGVFLEPDLKTSSRKFEFVFRMFSSGDAALPAEGMGAIAKQLAEGLPAGTIQLNTKATAVSPGKVCLEDNHELTAEEIVVACEAPAAAKLLGTEPPKEAHGVTCVYFSADDSPVNESILVLNGDGSGPINNLCVPSQLVPDCAPHGKSLISVTVLGTSHPQRQAKLLQDVVGQLREWFGPIVDDWDHLKTLSIPYSLPNQDADSRDPATAKIQSRNGVIVCGDYMENASINGAMVSGRRAAEQILANRSAL